jgi:hypothetical protein
MGSRELSELKREIFHLKKFPDCLHENMYIDKKYPV